MIAIAEPAKRSKSGKVLTPRTGLNGQKRTRPIPFSREEIASLFAALPGDCACGDRQRALYAALYRGAMRIAATLRIMPTDIDWDRQTVLIYRDKRKKTRAVALDSKTFGLFRAWADRRTALGIGDDSPFFCAYAKGSRGNFLSATSQSRKLKHYARKAGITRNVNLHLFRHTGASELLEEGFDVATISRVLGHVNMLTTFQYLHQLRPDLMNTKLAQREW